MGRPGFMVYFDILEPVRCLSDAQRGQLFLAMLEYGQTGAEPQFDGLLSMAWGFVKPRLDRDQEEYDRAVLQRQYAVVCREWKRRGEKPVSFQEWLRDRPLSGKEFRYPTTNTTTTTDTTTTTATTTTTTTATNTNTNTTTNTAAAETDDTAAAAHREMKLMGGELGKGVVLLSEEQMEDLLDKLGLDAFDHYVDKLSSFILKKDARVASHYDTILKWWQQDSGIERRGTDVQRIV